MQTPPTTSISHIYTGKPVPNYKSRKIHFQNKVRGSFVYTIQKSNNSQALRIEEKDSKEERTQILCLRRLKIFLLPLRGSREPFLLNLKNFTSSSLLAMKGKFTYEWKAAASWTPLNKNGAASVWYCSQYAIQHYALYRTSTWVREEHKREKKGWSTARG